LNKQYQYLFSVEEVNKLVLQGVPFRDAYKQIGNDIDKGNFFYSPSPSHTHEGSIGNLQHQQVILMMDKVLSRFKFGKVESALKQLLH